MADTRTGIGFLRAVLPGMMLSAGVWTTGLLLLAWFMTAGITGEGGGIALLSALTAVAAFTGAVSAVRHCIWEPLLTALAVGGLFSASLGCAGILLCRGISWTGHGGFVLLCAIGGAIPAALCVARKKGRRRRGGR